MTDEINEIIRVLQLTTYDEDEWDADQLTAMKRAYNALESKLQAAHDWLEVYIIARFAAGFVCSLQLIVGCLFAGSERSARRHR